MEAPGQRRKDTENEEVTVKIGMIKYHTITVVFNHDCHKMQLFSSAF